MIKTVHVYNITLKNSNAQHSKVKSHILIDKMLLAIFCLTLKVVDALTTCNELSSPKGKLCFVNDTYDKSQPSGPHPNYVNSHLWIHEIVDFNAEEQTITIFADFFVEWNDTRIQLKDSEDNWTEIDQELARSIYFPTLVFIKTKKVQEIKQISSTNEQYFWHIGQHLELKKHLMITLVCPLDFSHFPFDQHACNFTFRVSGSPAELVKLKPIKVEYSQKTTVFGQDPIQGKSWQIPFDVELTSLEPFDVVDIGYLYSHTGFTIRLKRNSLATLLGSFYVPTGLFALLSMTSYAIDPDVVPGRLGLLVTLFLIVTNVYGTVEAPKARNFSYIEVWMLGIQATILAAILEYGYILVQQKYYPKPDSMDWKAESKILDWRFFMGMFVSFIVFASAYWAFLLTFRGTN